MDNNKKNKKPLRLSSKGRLQLRKNLGPDQVRSSSSGKKSKTIHIVFKKKSSLKHDINFSRRPSFGKHTPNKPDIKKSSKPSPFPVLTKGDVNKKIDSKKFEDLYYLL